MKRNETGLSRGTLLGLAALLLLGGAACQREFKSGLSQVELTVGGHKLLAEVANGPEARTTGLMFRRTMAQNRGMLFVFPKAEPLSFWMKNTYLPLSVAFLNAQGIVLNIEDMEPQTEISHASRGPAMFALEMNRGWFAASGVKPGDRVEGVLAAPAASD